MTAENLLADYRERRAGRNWPGHPIGDERDAAHIADIMAAIDADPAPRVGDFVIFADGETRRISYRWDHDGYRCQTAHGTGSFALTRYGASYSGSLHPAVPAESLTLTDERRAGPCWVFHHDFARAHNGVTFYPEWRVYRCDREGPR